MAATSTRHALWRRLFLMLVIGGLLLLLALTGWRSFLAHFGGAFSYAPEDAPWVLSARAQALVEAAFEDLDGHAVIDYRAAVIADGQLGTGTIANDSFHGRSAGPLAWLRQQLRFSAAGIDKAGHADALYASRLLRQIDAMPGAYRVRLLARGWRYEDGGQRDIPGTHGHTANAYVEWLAQQAPDRIEPVVSIHPYRPDALERLMYWIDRGIKAVTWQPVRQNIELDDMRAIAFYEALAANDIELQLPIGAVGAGGDSARASIDPLALRSALTAGVTVIAAVHAHRERRDNVEMIDHLMRLWRAPQAGLLRVDLGGLLSGGTSSDVLTALLQHPRMHAHVRFASAYPDSAVNWHIDPGALAARGLLADDLIAPLREIYQVNPLLFVYVTMRSMRLPHTDLHFPPGVFSAGSSPPAYGRTRSG